MWYHRRFLNQVCIDDEIVGAVRQLKRPEVGQIIAWRDVKTLVAEAWRVIEISPDSEEGHSRLRLRHPEADPDTTLSGEGNDLFLTWRERPSRGAKKSTGSSSEDAKPEAPKFTHLSTHLGGMLILPEDYPVGALSGSLVPTAEVLWERIREADHEETSRFSNSSFCPGCGNPFLSDEPYRTFKTNLVVSEGPPVSFHTKRGGCWSVGSRYEEAYKKAHTQ